MWVVLVVLLVVLGVSAVEEEEDEAKWVARAWPIPEAPPGFVRLISRKGREEDRL